MGRNCLEENMDNSSLVGYKINMHLVVDKDRSLLDQVDSYMCNSMILSSM
jgi:hypothetical protein